MNASAKKSTPKQTTKSASKKRPPAALAGMAIEPQIVPGWYLVQQESTVGNGWFYEVGWVDVRDAGLGDGSTTEAWYLYAETIGSRHEYRKVGTNIRDALRFELVNATPTPPVGIRSTYIFTRCDAPRSVGP